MEEANKGFSPLQSEQSQARINDVRLEQARQAEAANVVKQQQDAINAFKERGRLKPEQSVSAEPFTLNPITPEQAKDYKDEASKGNSPLQNEAGKAEIDGFRETQANQAATALAAQQQEDAINAFKERGRQKSDREANPLPSDRPQEYFDAIGQMAQGRVK